jgi:hypothetical protein
MSDMRIEWENQNSFADYGGKNIRISDTEVRDVLVE